MEDRLKFLPGEQKKFLLQIQSKSGLSTNGLAELVGVAPRSFHDWKRGKLNLSLKAANLFCDRFEVILPEPQKMLIKRWKMAKLAASRKGGRVFLEKYGAPGTPEGRSKGGRMALALLRRRGLIPPVKSFNLPGFSAYLAEFVGILLGDGGITDSQVSITVNGEADKDYIPFITDLGEKLFNEKLRTTKREDSKAITLYYTGVSLVRFLIKIGLKKGNKVKQQVGIPEWVKSTKDYRLACLRGLMDTDGGVFLHRYKVGKKVYAYKKICFSNRSLPLLFFVADVLKELGLTPKVIDKVENKKVWLYNKSEVGCYLALVGTHNPRLLRHEQ